MQDPSQPQAAVQRITPSDVPMSPGMPAELVASLKANAAFARLDPSFRESPRFERLLRTHSRVIRCDSGDVIVREGDWGNSAFIVLAGEVAVEIESVDGFLSTEALGRRPPNKKSLWAAVAQLWQKQPYPEYRNVTDYATDDATTGVRDDGVRVYFQDVPRLIRDFKTIRLGEGDLFGELAALGRTARTATVFAVSDQSQLLEIRWQGLRDLMRADDGLRQQIDERFRENALRSFLRDSPLLEHVSNDPEVMDDLVKSAKFKTFGDYDKVSTFKELAQAGVESNLAHEQVVAAEGDYPNGVILIRSGFGRVSRRHHHGHRTLNYLPPGKAFGLEEIAEANQTGHGVVLKNSLRAIGFLSVIVIPTPLVEKYLLKRGANKQRDKISQSAPLDKGAAIEAEKLAFLVEGGFVNGTATMLVNLDRCTRCDDCVRACASTHDNNPRFLRQGPIHENVMVAHACMHCQDPVCMIECPTGAISRQQDEGVVTINDRTCIGCGACSKNCPYEAIRMVEVRDDRGMFIRATKDQKPIVKATKCDLCVDYLGGPACQRACPHDAMIRIDMGNVDLVSEWLRR